MPCGACFTAAAAMAPAAATAESVPSFLMDCKSLTGVVEVAEVADVRRLMFGGREVCRAFSYNPQALQMILPLISRLHNGVVLVPQFLFC